MKSKLNSRAVWENDTMFLAYRVTVGVPEPKAAALIVAAGFGALFRRGGRRRE
jgi:hypothetical protein